MKTVTLTINGFKTTVPEGTTILDAARTVNIKIPTLCYLDLHDIKMVN
ncbi:MAG: 2Fe-2S iron-sulfur cluster-binding protein, partial [Clostridium sp.]|nr:2Fe-2S iron-sulfur cluster-binding protein [Clostridium sp.]